MRSCAPMASNLRGKTLFTMRAAILTHPETIEIREIPRPVPQADEVQIRVESCGVCASNVVPFEGRPWFSYPFEPGAPGHEACGRIQLLGRSVSGWQAGDRVAFLSNHGFAEYDVAKVEAIAALPPQFEEEQIPAEPIGCVMNIFRRSEIKPGMTTHQDIGLIKAAVELIPRLPKTGDL